MMTFVSWISFIFFFSLCDTCMSDLIFVQEIKLKLEQRAKTRLYFFFMSNFRETQVCQWIKFNYRYINSSFWFFLFFSFREPILTFKSNNFVFIKLFIELFEELFFMMGTGTGTLNASKYHLSLFNSLLIAVFVYFV